MANFVSTKDLTPAARVTLINTGFRAGSVVPMGTRADVLAELHRHGLVGTCDGLTRAGSIVRARCLDEALEAMEW